MGLNKELVPGVLVLTTAGRSVEWCENCHWSYEEYRKSVATANTSPSIEQENPLINTMHPRAGFLLDSQTIDDNATQNGNATDCGYMPNEFLDEKFALVTIFGTSVCVFGFITNCLLVHILVRSTLIKTHVFYLAVLAVCDIVTEFSYVALMSVQIFFDYAKDVQLYIAWNGYVRYVYTMTHVSLTIATYMIVSASAEKYLASSKFLRGQCTRKHRWLTTFAVLIFAFLSKGLVFWELDVVHKVNCTFFEAYEIRPSALAMYPPYRIGYTLWFRHFAHVFFPFILLLFLNGAILSRLKRRPLERSIQSALVQTTMGQMARERKKSIRAATMMLGAIVTTYLISNLLNVVVTIWEHIDLQFLLEHRKFYTFAADTVNLLTVLTGAIRFPIYCACNPQLRRELRRLLITWCRGTRVIADFGKRVCVNAKEKEVIIETTCVQIDGHIAFNTDIEVTSSLTASV